MFNECATSAFQRQGSEERTLYLLRPSSLIWHLMPYLFLFLFEAENSLISTRTVMIRLRERTKDAAKFARILFANNVLYLYEAHSLFIRKLRVYLANRNL